MREIIRLFCLDIEAKKSAESTNLNRSTVNNIYRKLRERITELCEAESTFTNGEVELDERRILGIKGRGARGKKHLFSVCSNEATMSILKQSKTALYQNYYL